VEDRVMAYFKTQTWNRWRRLWKPSSWM